jgi:hypothetical protein
LQPKERNAIKENSEVRVDAATEGDNYREINIEFLAKGGV